jgi:hypothetical protein
MMVLTWRQGWLRLAVDGWMDQQLLFRTCQRIVVLAAVLVLVVVVVAAKISHHCPLVSDCWLLRRHLDLVAGKCTASPTRMQPLAVMLLAASHSRFCLLVLFLLLLSLCIIQPFEAIFDFIRQINNFLEKLITWPRECGNGKFSLVASMYIFDVHWHQLSHSIIIFLFPFLFSHCELPTVFPISNVRLADGQLTVCVLSR